MILTLLDKQQMQALTLWVKDMVQVRRELSFDGGIMRPVFVQALMNTLSQETRQKEQKKVGESFHDFLKTKLKSQAQQEISNEEFDSTLGMIISACGIPLSYVIHKTDWQFGADIPYDEAIIHAVSLEGDEFC